MNENIFWLNFYETTFNISTAVMSLLIVVLWSEIPNHTPTYIVGQAAILKVTSLKINRPLPIYISIVPIKFGVDIQSQTKVRVWKPKNPIWPPGGHFENDLAENQ